MHSLRFLILTVGSLLLFSAAAAEQQVYFRENFEGTNPMEFRSCGEPTTYMLALAEDKGLVKVHRAGITAQDEGKSHGDVRSFALDVTLDKLSGRWGGTAAWVHRQKLSIPLDKPVYLTAYVYPEQLPPDFIASVEIGVIFDGEKNGKPIRNGCLTFKAKGVDAEGWLVFQCDAAELAGRIGWSKPVMTGWQLTLRGQANKTIDKQRIKVFLDDVSITSRPEKIRVVGGRGSVKVADLNILPGPHTVGYTSLYRDFPKSAKNRIWNSSFENGFAHWYMGVVNETYSLPEFETTFLIRKGGAPHGNNCLEIARPDGKPTTVRVSTMPVLIEDGRDYVFSFYAKASKKDEKLICNGRQISLGTEWKRYTIALPSIQPETYSWNGKKFPNRRTFSFSNTGDANIMLDAVQLERGTKASAFSYPEMVSVSARPGNRLGLYLPSEKPEFEWMLFNGFAQEQPVTVTARISDFAHRPIKTLEFRKTLKPGAGETQKIALPPGFRHYKIAVSAAVPGQKTQSAVTAVSVVDDLTQLPNREFFGQLATAAKKPENFADVLRLNQLLGVHSLLVYNQLRLDRDSAWRTNSEDKKQRNFVIDQIRKWGFEPELAIMPFGLDFPKDGNGVQIIGEKELAEIKAWCENFANEHKHNLSRYEIFGEYMQGDLPPRARNVAKILPVVYRTLKQVNPACHVDAFGEDNLPGICQELGAHFKLGTLQYADTVTIHPYWIAKQNQEGLDAGLKSLRKLVDSYAPGKPIAVTEAGHRAVDTLHYDDIDPESMYYQLHCTELEHAERTVREYLISMGNGLTRYTAFFTYSGESLFTFTYVQTGNSIRPKTVFPAYNFMVKELSGAKLLNVISRPENRIRIYIFTKGGDTFAAMWHYADDHSAKDVKIALAPDSVKAFNLVGEPLTLTGKELSFPLDGKVVYLHAGSNSRDTFLRAVERLKQDTLVLSVAPRDTKEFTVQLENGTAELKGVLTVSGHKPQNLTLRPNERRVLSFPTGTGKQSVSWRDGKKTIEKDISFFPVGKGAPAIKLGREQRVSRFSRFAEFAYRGEDDLSAEFKGHYDKTNFYLDVTVKDDIFANPYSSRNKKHFIWANDAIQIAFDNTGEPGYLELNCSLTGEGPEIFVSNFGKVDASRIRFTAQRNAPYIRYQLEIPWRAMWKNFTPSAKPQIRFNIAVVDNDGPPKKTWEVKDQFIGDKQALLFTPGIMTGDKTAEHFAWILFQ